MEIEDYIEMVAQGITAKEVANVEEPYKQVVVEATLKRESAGEYRVGGVGEANASMEEAVMESKKEP